jgi:ubiquinone/menaquinone biosynthesis C-methylase UbiE
MGFYASQVAPCLTHLSMRNRTLVPYRQRVLAAATGRVLEVGIGSGHNLPFYGPQAREVLGLDPSPRLLQLAARAAGGTARPVSLIEGSAEAIPLEDRSVDTVVTTWTLCTIPEPIRALEEMRRVLRAGGQLLFVEHGRAPDARVQAWQDRLNPAWCRFSGGCNLNRPIRGLIESAGLRVQHVESGYARGPKMMAFFSEGRALP